MLQVFLRFYTVVIKTVLDLRGVCSLSDKNRFVNAIMLEYVLKHHGFMVECNERSFCWISIKPTKTSVAMFILKNQQQIDLTFITN